MNRLPQGSTRGLRHLVASADHLAARAGDIVFAAGGNAVDAAIATNAAIAVDWRAILLADRAGDL